MVQNMIESGIDSSFTKKDIHTLGIKIPEIAITSAQIKEIRKKRYLSQTVFAQVLNVSPSSVRQWEQGKRISSGSTKVLLELLNRSPQILDYRINT